MRGNSLQLRRWLPSAGDDEGHISRRELLIAARGVRQDSMTQRGWPVNIGFGGIRLTARDVIQQGNCGA